ncbi:hypothetical protein MNBD_BACTEROID06-75 [hydrothermal vent metagenome]|uniref:Uncharacterized protein n=1 Tax=hydrothermal vent metagenome TaxID=652676 RepID=A0A3B0V1A3_9ZZZZ
MKFTLPLLFLFLASISFAQTQSTKDQIASAVLAASKVQRNGATVMGYNADGKFITLRKGSNELICLADNPNQKGFSVACYHKDLEPMMARGRALKSEGKNSGEIDKIRAEEAVSGKLKMPKSATTLHVLSGASAHYDAAKNEVVGATLRYVVYIPFATQETTGLPLQPVVKGGPWLMFPGTYRAHIMINPVN